MDISDKDRRTGGCPKDQLHLHEDRGVKSASSGCISVITHSTPRRCSWAVLSVSALPCILISDEAHSRYAADGEALNVCERFPGLSPTLPW